jgi:hypothetical protein
MNFQPRQPQNRQINKKASVGMENVQLPGRLYPHVFFKVSLLSYCVSTGRRESSKTWEKSFSGTRRYPWAHLLYRTKAKRVGNQGGK